MKQIEYYEILKDQLDRQVHEEADAIEKAAQYCAESVCKKRLIHVFGCGHSQMFAMEVFYRAADLPDPVSFFYLLICLAQRFR